MLRGHEDMASCSSISSQLTRALRREGSEETPPSYCSAFTILRDWGEPSWLEWGSRGTDLS